MSKFEVCTTLGGRKNAEKPKREFSEFFGSVGSVFRSVRSILRPRVVVDHPGKRFLPQKIVAFFVSVSFFSMFYIKKMRRKSFTFKEL